MRRLILLLTLMGSLTIQAADLFITPDSSLADAVRRAREMRSQGDRYCF